MNLDRMVIENMGLINAFDRKHIFNVKMQEVCKDWQHFIYIYKLSLDEHRMI